MVRCDGKDLRALFQPGDVQNTVKTMLRACGVNDQSVKSGSFPELQSVKGRDVARLCAGSGDDDQRCQQR